jgi:hypothetical protein
MVRAATLVCFLFVTTMWSQVKIYEFDTLDMRTPDGWEIRKISGEIHIDDKCKEITFITPNFVFVYNILSKQQFIKVGSYLYSAYDWRDEIIRIKIDKGDEYSNYLDFYYYSDEKDMKYFRLCLTRCPYDK